MGIEGFSVYVHITNERPRIWGCSWVVAACWTFPSFVVTLWALFVSEHTTTQSSHSSYTGCCSNTRCMYP